VRRGLLLGLLALLALNLAVGLVFTIPRVWAERSLSERAKTLEAEVAREKEFLLSEKRREETIKANGQDVQKLYHAQLATYAKGLVPSIAELDQIAIESGLNPGPESFQKVEVKGAPLLEVSIKAPLAGGYPQIVSFLSRIERSPRFFVVDRMQLSSHAEGSEDLMIEVSTYFFTGGGA
jgi:Tfp pilus assembly protein PilO